MEGVLCFVGVGMGAFFRGWVGYPGPQQTQVELVYSGPSCSPSPQAHNCTRKDFEKMYPAFPKFCAIRDKLDPAGMFLNAYLEKVFY